MQKLKCSCCGGDAGKFQQWHNRDKGYGICAKCVNWCLSLGETETTIFDNYGVAGINYQLGE